MSLFYLAKLFYNNRDRSPHRKERHSSPDTMRTALLDYRGHDARAREHDAPRGPYGPRARPCRHADNLTINSPVDIELATSREWARHSNQPRRPPGQARENRVKASIYAAT